MNYKTENKQNLNNIESGHEKNMTAYKDQFSAN